MNLQNTLKTLLVTLVISLLVSCVSTPIQVPTGTNPPATLFPSSTSTPDYNIRTNSGQILLDFALSQNGKRLAVFTNQDVYLYDITTQNKTIVKHFDNNDYVYFLAGAVAFNPDDTKIAVSGKFADQPINFWDINSEKWAETIVNIPNGYYVKEIEFSPNGERVVVRNNYPSSIHCEGPEDKLVLYDVTKLNDSSNWRDTDLYDMDGCSIVPDKFRFINDDKLFLHTSGTSPAYSIFFIDINTGQIISKDTYDDNAAQDNQFYDISANGKVIAIQDSHDKTTLRNIETKEMLGAVIENEVILFQDEKKFLVHNYNTRQWSFWENGKFKCAFGDTQIFDFKTSLDGNVLGVFNSPKHELQLWNIQNCEMIDTLLFNE